MKFTPEFKKAISQIPSSEKDKLILRLLKRDLILANQLYFNLLDGDSVQSKRKKMEELVRKKTDQMCAQFYSPGYLLIDMRYLSGDITEHVKITRDKFGEASLNLLMLTETLKKCSDKIMGSPANKCYTLGIYVIARIFKILIIIKSLHEDFLIEFEDGLKALGKLISENPRLASAADANKFNVNWLLKPSIPDNIANIHKDIKAKGYLK